MNLHSRLKSNKKAAIELSLGTIVIIVLGVTMLILGMVLVRGVMCSAMGLTGAINGKMESELNKYFGETEDEVVCIGESDPIKMAPDADNLIHCSIKAKQQAKYEFTIVDYGSTINRLTKEKITPWIKQGTSADNVAPDDRSPKKIARIQIPDSAPEGNIWFKLEIKKDGELLRTKTLDFAIARAGFIKSKLC
jgi:hypothetical protein